MSRPRCGFFVGSSEIPCSPFLRCRLDTRMSCLCLPVTREQLAIAQDKAVRLREANAVLAEQVVEAECDHDTTAADSTAIAARASQYRDHHAAL